MDFPELPRLKYLTLCHVDTLDYRSVPFFCPDISVLSEYQRTDLLWHADQTISTFGGVASVFHVVIKIYLPDKRVKMWHNRYKFELCDFERQKLAENRVCFGV